MFTDFEGDRVVSSRYYKDAFPNELSEVNDLNNYMNTISNDQGDDDSSNDMTTQAPNIQGLLSLSHPDDNVLAVFDHKTVFEGGEEISTNILATTETILMPGRHGKSGMGAGLNFTIDVIKSTPKGGVFYDSNEGLTPEKREGSYLYFNSNDESEAYETIFVTDSNGKVIAVGFDYDHDSFFWPNKRILVEKHIYDSDNTTGSKDFFNVLNFAPNDLVNFNDTDSYNGKVLDITFADALFDVWKMDYSSDSSQLIEEVRQLTNDKYIETLGSRLFEDVMWQIEASAWGYIGGCIGMIIGSVAEGHPVIGYHVGFFIGYATANIMHAFDEKEKMDAYLTFQRLHNEDYAGPKTLSEKSADFISADALGSSLTAVHANVRALTIKHDYVGNIVLAPMFQEKTSDFGTKYLPITLDYSLQSRNLMGYSDTDNQLLAAFLDTFYGTEPEVMHDKNSILYLEDQIFQATTSTYDDNAFDFFSHLFSLDLSAQDSASVKEQPLDRIVPISFYGVPTLEFASSRAESKIPLPDFYEEYPIFVPKEKFDSLTTDTGFEGNNIVFKVFDGTTSEITIFPEGTVHALELDLTSLKYYLIDELYTDSGYYGYPRKEAILSSSFYSFDKASGVLTLNAFGFNCLNDELEDGDMIVLELNFEKFRSISDTRDDSEKKITEIAAMQAVQASVLEYLYQFKVAQDVQSRLEEIAHTVYVTLITVPITMLMTYGMTGNTFTSVAKKGTLTSVTKKSTLTLFGKEMAKSLFTEPLEEVFVDPVVESIATSIAAELGADAYQQIVASTLAESGRESVLGPMTKLLRHGQVNTRTDVQSIRYQDILRTPDQIKMDVIRIQQESIQSQLDSGSYSTALIHQILTTTAMFEPVLSGITAPDVFSTILAEEISAITYCCEGLSLKDAFGYAIGIKTFDAMIDGFEGVESDMDFGNPLKGLFEKYPVIESFSQFDANKKNTETINQFQWLKDFSCYKASYGENFGGKFHDSDLKNVKNNDNKEIQKTIANYIPSLKKPKSIQQLKYRHTYFSKEQIALYEIWKNRQSRAKKTFGIIYKWTYKNARPGEKSVMYGRSEQRPLSPSVLQYPSFIWSYLPRISIGQISKRLEYYIWRSIKEGSEKPLDKIYRVMYDIYKEAEDNGRDGITAIMESFDLEIVEIIYETGRGGDANKDYIENVETWWMEYGRRHGELLFNKVGGSTGSHVGHGRKINDIPLLVNLFEEGAPNKYIRKKFNLKTNGPIYTIINDMFPECEGSIIKLRDLYFLPKLEDYMKHDFMPAMLASKFKYMNNNEMFTYLRNKKPEFLKLLLCSLYLKGHNSNGKMSDKLKVAKSNIHKIFFEIENEIYNNDELINKIEEFDKKWAKIKIKESINAKDLLLKIGYSKLDLQAYIDIEKEISKLFNGMDYDTAKMRYGFKKIV
ncbi:MAG: hypothetical protein ACTSRI_19415 [Promethearchaeota archaeon]